MEEEILKLLQEALQYSFEEEVCENIAASEITSHVIEFIKWCIVECFTSSTENEDEYTYYFWDEESYRANEPKSFSNIEGLYEYWLNNIKK